MDIGKSSFRSCFSGVVFCLLGMFSLNGRKLRLGRWRWCPGVVVGCQVAGCGAGVVASCSAKRHNPHSCSRQKKRGPASVTGHRAWLCWNKLIFSCCYCCCCCCCCLQQLQQQFVQLHAETRQLYERGLSQPTVSQPGFKVSG